MAMTINGYKNQLVIEQRAREFIDGKAERVRKRQAVKVEVDHEGSDPNGDWYFEPVS